MLGKLFAENVTVSLRSRWPIFAFLVNTIAWSYMVTSLIGNFLASINVTYAHSLTYMAVYYFATLTFTIIGGILASKVEKFRALIIWTAFGGIMTSLPIFLEEMTAINMLVICFIWGTSIGVGMPLCLAHLSEVTHVEERGRTSGAILFVTYMVYFCILILTQHLDPKISSAGFAIWRYCGFIPILYMRRKNTAVKSKAAASFSSVFCNKSFILYFIPSLVFFLVDTTEQPAFINFFGRDLYNLMSQIELIVGGIFTFIGGLLLDFIGRKRTIIPAFAALGIGYAVLSLATTVPGSLMFYFIIDGIAWGILTPAFMLTLWGDISPSGTGERYFAVGTIPVYLAGVVRAILAPGLVRIPIYSAFSFASLFLFLATIPLLYAPETLPEEVLKRRRLMRYIGKVKKISDKMRV